MKAITVAKSAALNLLEGLTLVIICHALPTFATTVMMLKLAREQRIVGDPGGAAVFVSIASVLFALIVCTLGRSFRASSRPMSRPFSIRPCRSPTRSSPGANVR